MTTRPIKNAFASGRNEPCICGSGRKFKKCCMVKVEALGSGDLNGFENKSKKCLDKSKDITDILQPDKQFRL